MSHIENVRYVDIFLSKDICSSDCHEWNFSGSRYFLNINRLVRKYTNF